MLRTSTLVALAAAITFGATMLAPGSAEASPYKIIKPKHHHHHFHYPRWRRPIVVVAPRPVVYAAAPVRARPVASGPCTCLSKEYTQEGAVLFKDRCTSEMAMNPPMQAPQQTTMQVAPQMETTPPQQMPQTR